MGTSTLSRVDGGVADGSVLSVNLARVRSNLWGKSGVTGIDKRPEPGPVLVRAPGDKTHGLGSGLVGDTIGDLVNHGGDDQAVYAYAREDLDHWESRLGRELPAGAFGENLTTTGVDVSHALVGERWQIGDEVRLQVTCPRIPCSTFRGWIDERGWLRTFTVGARPGAYLRVVGTGHVRQGDPVTVLHRPRHDVTVAMVFRALTREPALLPDILAADELPDETREMAAEGRTFSLG
jgi:MOSC domain-containing protein YiiM